MVDRRGVQELTKITIEAQDWHEAHDKMSYFVRGVRSNPNVWVAKIVALYEVGAHNSGTNPETKDMTHR